LPETTQMDEAGGRGSVDVLPYNSCWPVSSSTLHDICVTAKHRC